MQYTIKIDYQTGSSFGSEDTTDEVGCSWTDLNKAKEALQRIKCHYNAYAELNQRHWNPSDRKASDFANEPWFWKEEPRFWEQAVIVERDDGTEQRLSTFWCGCFERLYSAEIIVDGPYDTDMKVSF